MPPPTPPLSPDDIPAWILRQALAGEDSRALVDGLGTALNTLGVPVLRVGVSLATRTIAHRGIG